MRCVWLSSPSRALHRLKVCRIKTASGRWLTPLHQGSWRNNSCGVRTVAEAVSSSKFVKPLSEVYPPLPCRVCKGAGEVVCDKCSGKGRLALGGYHRKNPVDMDRVVGSKWTAMERTLGWRHYEARAKKKLEKDWFVQMAATCDPKTQLWVNVQNLKDRKLWSMGWLQKSDYTKEQSSSSEAEGPRCKACKGQGKMDCQACDGAKAVAKNHLKIIDV